jgi:hypothetical protein
MTEDKPSCLWKDKIINHHALGGIETAVLDNGPGRGTRVAWINTGSGLRYRVVLDRGLDIADASFNQHSLAWLSHGGLTAPRPDANQGLEWLHTFGGGFLTTCGLTHVGGPEKGENGERGLHGRISNLPGQIESVIQPDPLQGQMEMKIIGTMRQSSLFGPNLELRRVISSTLGQSVIRVSDVVTNRGNTAAPHMILYHCNYGWPLVDEGADIVWQGAHASLGRDMDNAIFNDQHDYKKCQGPLESHRGSGEACAAIEVTPDQAGVCRVGIHNPELGLALQMQYPKTQLPWLTNWQHWGVGDYVCALEPGTNPPIGQNRAREENALIFLQPGESRQYDLEFNILTDASDIQQFLTSRGGKV